MMDLKGWLQRRRPDRIVCKPSGNEWPRPANHPWTSLVELAGDSDHVLAYQGEKLLGIWRRDAVESVAAPRPRVDVSAACPDTRGTFREELDMMREMFKAQAAMMREVIASQSVALRAVRGNVRVGGDDDDDDGESNGADSEMESMLRAALLKAGLGGEGDATSDLMRAALAKGFAK